MFDDFKSWHERDNWANTEITAHALQEINRRFKEERRALMTPEQLKAEAEAEKIASWIVMIILLGFFSVIAAVIIWVCCQ